MLTVTFNINEYPVNGSLGNNNNNRARGDDDDNTLIFNILQNKSSELLQAF